MTSASIDVIVRAQTILMVEHDVTSEAALSLLVWTATERGTTVLDVACRICQTASDGMGTGDRARATA